MSMKRFPELKPTGWDAAVAAAVILLAVMLGTRVWGGASDGLSAVLTVDGVPKETITLTGDEQVNWTVSSNGYTLEIHLAEDAVWVEHSDCPTQDCVHTGKISRAGQSIVCLPARVSIQLQGDSGSGGVDTVIG